MVWTVVAAALAVIEMTTGTLVFIMLAVGAAAAAGAAGLGADPIVQLIAFSGVSVATLLAVRPAAVKRLHNAPEHRMGVEALVGREAIVVQRVDGQDGRVRISGEIWSARAYDGHSEYEVGSRVDIAQIEGATALVL